MDGKIMERIQRVHRLVIAMIVVVAVIMGPQLFTIIMTLCQKTPDFL